MNREQLIVELTNLNPNENRQDVDDELMPLIDQYAERVALEARIDAFRSYRKQCGILRVEPTSLGLDRQIERLEAQLSKLNREEEKDAKT